MGKRDEKSKDAKIKALELELRDREKELLEFRQELAAINEQLEAFIQKMAVQLQLANLMQRSLVPSEIPTISGFEFSTKFVASTVSGSDYFDIFEMEDRNRFGILMASSSGHGVAALFLSLVLKMTSQFVAKKGLEPDQVLKKINEEIHGKVSDSQEVHAFFGIVDKKDLSLTYSLSGDLAVQHSKNESGKSKFLPMTQPALGQKMGRLQFKNETLHLEPRDKLVLISAGFAKVLNKKGESLGKKRVQEFGEGLVGKGLHEARNEMLYQAKKFAQGEPYPQDLSIIVVGVKDKVVKLRRVTS